MSIIDFEQQRRQVLIERALSTLAHVLTSVTVEHNNCRVSVIAEPTQENSEFIKTQIDIATRDIDRTQHKLLTGALYVALTQQFSSGIEITIINDDTQFTYHFNPTQKEKHNG